MTAAAILLCLPITSAYFAQQSISQPLPGMAALSSTGHLMDQTSIFPPNISGRPSGFPGPGSLFVGACYQPIDRTESQILQDVAIMKKAGFNVVRLGDLSWDTFEPEEGRFEFAWCDFVLDLMHKNGIRVVLDIPGAPAPIWLHKKYPGVDLVNQEGNRLPPAERYMDNISDPNYVRRMKVLAEKILSRYSKHPSVIAVGYNNEIGNGFMSYSKADRTRFISWLKKRYGTIEELNRVWATQRWSRRLNSFDDVDLPLKNGPGPAERYLDLHRYWSDVTVARLKELEEVRRKWMPDIPSMSNLWDYSWRRGFDYFSSYKDYTSFGAQGFYQGGAIDGSFAIMLTKGDLPTPTWQNEFTAGGGGWYGDPGRSRMLTFVSLLSGTQGVLAWTFNSHTGGEEQALFGLLDHDGKPSWKVQEWAKIASDFKTLSQYGFPRYFQPKAAVAYSFESAVASSPNGPSNTTRQYFKGSYMDQVTAAHESFYRKNIDSAVINISNHDLSHYELVVLPAHYLIDQKGAKAIRDYEEKGGNVLMTGYSAKVNEHSQWFETGLPGLLGDVFGLRTAAFYRNDSGVEFTLDGKEVASKASYYEILEPTTSEPIGLITNSYITKTAPILTVNRFGKGRAYYLAAESHYSAIGPVLDFVRREVGIPDGPAAPEGVYAREVSGRTFYVNTNYNEVRFPTSSPKKGLLSGRTFEKEIVLEPKGGDLIE